MTGDPLSAGAVADAELLEAGYGIWDDDGEAIRASEVIAEQVRWLWPGRLPCGKVVILDGDPGLGKSTLTLDLAARLTTGRCLPDGHQPEGKVNALVLSAEDGAGDTIRPRLEAAAADLERIWLFDHVRDFDEKNDEYYHRPIELPGDLARIQRIVIDHAVGFVIIDPLVAFLGVKTDAHRDQDVRRVLYPLAQLAGATGATILCLRHLNKAPGTNPLYRGGGSIGFIGAARLGLLVAPHPDDETQRVLAVAKSNLAAKPESLVFELCADDVRGVAYLGWKAGTSPLTATDLLRAVPKERDAPKRNRARNLLEEMLAAGPCLRSDIEERAEEEGISWRTIETAKADLGVATTQVPVPGQKGAGPAWWHHPDDDPMNGPQSSSTQEDCGPLDPSAPNSKTAGQSLYIDLRVAPERSTNGIADHSSPIPIADHKPSHAAGGWTSFDEPIGSCLECGWRCSYRDPVGDVRHPGCHPDGGAR